MFSSGMVQDTKPLVSSRGLQDVLVRWLPCSLTMPAFWNLRSELWSKVVGLRCTEVESE
jgi:hypothetical protein